MATIKSLLEPCVRKFKFHTFLELEYEIQSVEFSHFWCCYALSTQSLYHVVSGFDYNVYDCCRFVFESLFDHNAIMESKERFCGPFSYK